VDSLVDEGIRARRWTQTERDERDAPSAPVLGRLVGSRPRVRLASRAACRRI